MITLPSGVADSLPKAWPRRLALPCSRQAIQYLRFGHLKYISRVDDCHAICLLSQCQCFRRSSQRGIANMAVQRSFAWQAWIPEHLRGAGTLAGRARGSLPASLSCGNINIKDLDAQKLSTYVCHEHGDFLRLKERVNLHHLRPYRVHSPYHSCAQTCQLSPPCLCPVASLLSKASIDHPPHNHVRQRDQPQETSSPSRKKHHNRILSHRSLRHRRTLAFALPIATSAPTQADHTAEETYTNARSGRGGRGG